MKKKIYAVLFVLFLLGAAVAGYVVISDLLEYKQAADYYRGLENDWVTVSEPNPESTESPSETPEASPAVTKPDESPAPATETPVPSYTRPGRTAPIAIDFEGLCHMNPEIVGWIYCEGTQISYPVLRGTDNQKYLKIQPDGKTSKSGSIFIDCACEADFSSDNTIVYGHNLKNGMFSSLSEYRKQEYYEAHPVWWLLTPGGDYKIEVFSAFVVDAGAWVYQIGLGDEDAKAAFIERCLRYSNFESTYTPSPGDRLITLSTCNYTFNDARYVVVGALVPVD